MLSQNLYRLAKLIYAEEEIEITVSEHAQNILKQILIFLNGAFKLLEKYPFNDLKSQISFLEMVNQPKEASAWKKTFEDIRKQLVTIYNALFDDFKEAQILSQELALDCNKYLKLNGLTFSLENFSDISQFKKLRNEERIQEWCKQAWGWFNWIKIREVELHPLVYLLKIFGYNVQNFRDNLTRAETPFVQPERFYPLSDFPGSIRLDFSEIYKRINQLEERMIIFFPRETDKWKQMEEQSKTSVLLISKK